MANLPLTLVIKDYDHIMPLACGDVAPEGIDLKLDRDSPGALDRTLNDPSIQAGELVYGVRYQVQIYDVAGFQPFESVITAGVDATKTFELGAVFRGK